MLPEKLLQELEVIKKEQFVHSYSQETFDDIFIPWLFKDEETAVNLSKISSEYMASKFILEYLMNVNHTLKSNYDIPSLSSKDVSNKEKVEEISSRVIEILTEPSILWLKEECIPTLTQILYDLNVETFEKLIELGLIEDVLITSLSEGKKNSVEEYYFEIFYQFKDRLKEANFLDGSKNPINISINIQNVTVENGGEVLSSNPVEDVESYVGTNEDTSVVEKKDDCFDTILEGEIL